MFPRETKEGGVVSVLPFPWRRLACFSAGCLRAGPYGFMQYTSLVMAWLELRLQALSVYRGTVMGSLPGR
jgi:hypothetical protein